MGLWAQIGEAGRQLRNAPQPKYYNGPSNRSGGMQAAAQEALAGQETPLLVRLPVLFQGSQSTSKVALHVQFLLAPLSSMKLPWKGTQTARCRRRS